MNLFLKLAYVFLFLVSFNTTAQSINYESKALDYFINNIESDSIFSQSCDCANIKYDIEKELVIYDSSYFVIDPHVVSSKFKLINSDTSLLNWSTTSFEVRSSSKRVRTTSNFKYFSSDHYLIRFSNKLEFYDSVFIEFIIKSEERCSDINFLFCFDSNGEIRDYKTIVWCDSPG